MKPNTLIAFIPLGIALATVLSVCAAAGIATESAAAVSVPPAAADRPADDAAIAAVFSPSVRAWEPEIIGWSEEFGLDPNLAATVMQIESCGNPSAVSRAGAQGLFQVMPFHFSDGEDMQAPAVNARRGLEYLAGALLKSEGDIRRALAGYNGGHGVIDWNPSQWSAETKRYAYWGEGIYADAAAGRSSSPRLEEWLAAGGASLCEQAAIIIS